MKIINIVGARPNFIKIAPLVREMAKKTEIEQLLVHTGQHYDDNMSKVFFDDLNLPRPNVDLGVGSGSHAVQTAQVMIRFEPILLNTRPDLIVVVGDVNSTLACSLVAAKLHVPIAHIEAGVRSFDRRMPEEINRILTDSISDLLFTPSRNANHNLKKEGIPEENIYLVGNVMMDTLSIASARSSQQETWKRWGLEPSGYAVLTLHRPSNVDDRPTLEGLVLTLVEISKQIPIIAPLHPRTRMRIHEFQLDPLLASAPQLLLVDPVGYLDFLCLLSHARLVLTDSGGIQTETTMLGVPCLTLRWNTEWQETIEQGTNQLVGTDPERIKSAASAILANRYDYGHRLPELWDGKTAARIVETIIAHRN